MSNRTHHALLTTAILATLGLSAARADYQVETAASGWSSHTYNYGFVGAHSTLNPNSTAFGTPDLTGTATAAFSTASGNPPPDGNGQRINTAGTEHGDANLATATVSNSEYDTGVNGIFTGSDGGTAKGYLHDTLHVTVAGATPSTVTLLTIHFFQSGHMLQSGTNPTGNGDTNVSLNFGGQSLRTEVKLDSSHAYSPYINVADTYPAGFPGSFGTTTVNSFSFTGTYAVTGPSANIPLTLDMTTFSVNGMDTSYTASLTFDAPQSLTFTSDSGVFASLIPEPTSLTLIALAGVSTLRRRSNKSAH